MSSDQARALLHAGDSGGALGERLLRIEPLASVLDQEPEALRIGTDFDAHQIHAGMARRVRERLLNDPERGDLEPARIPVAPDLLLKLHADPGPLGVPF